MDLSLSLLLLLLDFVQALLLLGFGGLNVLSNLLGGLIQIVKHVLGLLKFGVQHLSRLCHLLRNLLDVRELPILSLLLQVLHFGLLFVHLCLLELGDSLGFCSDLYVVSFLLISLFLCQHWCLGGRRC